MIRYWISQSRLFVFMAGWVGMTCGFVVYAEEEPARWLEVNGLLVMEAEKGTPESADTWEVRSDVNDFVGDGFIRWEGPDYLSNRSHGVMVYRFIISTPGRYRLFLRSFHDPASRGKRNDEENDCWTNMELNSTSSYYKTFRNAVLAGGDWSYRTQWVLADEEFVDAFYQIPAGEHEFRLAARAAYFMIDRIVLIKDSSTIDEYAPESPMTGTTYVKWLEQNFSESVRNNPELEASVWGFDADPDGDGLANAFEFYSGSDPLAADSENVFVNEWNESGSRLRLLRALGVEGIRMNAELSTDMQVWEERPDLISDMVIDGQDWTVITFPETLNEGHFLRFSAQVELE